MMYSCVTREQRANYACAVLMFKTVHKQVLKTWLVLLKSAPDIQIHSLMFYNPDVTILSSGLVVQNHNFNSAFGRLWLRR